MKCKKCGAENSDASKFCKNCGVKLEENVHEHDDSGKLKNNRIESKTNGFITTLKSLPKKKLFFLAIGIVAIIGVAIFLNMPKTINFNNYLVFEESGYDGYGNCDVYLDWDRIEEDYVGKISFSSKAKKQFDFLQEYDKRDIDEYAIDILKEFVSVDYDNIGNLSNGDEVPYWFDIEDELGAAFNCKLNYSDGKFKISNLQEANKIDFFKGIDNSLIKFEGRNGKANLVFNEGLVDGAELNRNDDFIVVLKDDYKNKIIKVIKDNQELTTLYFEFSKDKDLSNGDEVLVSLSNPLALIDLGYLPERDHITFTVSGRPELIASMTKEEAGVIEDYLSEKIQANHSENYTYSNANIHRVYFGKAKETTVTDYPYVILVDYSYSYDYSSSYYSNHQDYDNYAIFYNAYKDGSNIVFEKENTGNSYSSWGFQTIEEVMENLQSDYEFEMIWE